MQAIVKISGKQYRLSAGDRVTVDRLGAPVGDQVTFDQVLMLSDASGATVGTPVVEGATVTARVVAQPRGPKIIVFKYKAKKRYRRTQGSRAEQSLLEVVSVTGPGEKPARKTADKPAQKAADKPAGKATAEPAAETEA